MANEVWLIDMNTLWQCETCFHHYPNGCDTYCDHGESYRPAADQLTVIDPESLRPKGRWEHINKHLWYKDENGMVDIWRVDYGFHNGPECEVCHESFCMHCTPDWEEQVCEVGHYVCSNCGEVSKKNTPYCPNCGADMRGESK